MIDVLLLGTGGMLPLPDRWLSALLVRCQGELTLFDCGEGTQIVWRRFGWGFRRLGAICVSHTHADHIAGLPGLLHAVANAGREEPVRLFGPPGTAEVVAGLRRIAPVLPFALDVEEVGEGARFPLAGGLEGRTAEGDHGLPVLAYRVAIERSRPFSPERAEALGVPVPLWRSLQHGQEVVWPGGRATPDEVLGAARPGLSIAYVTDTRPRPSFRAFLSGVDLLVCEGTYGDPADAPKAEERGHMTFAEAALLARDADVGQLWITHFSPGLTEPEAYREVAAALFPRTTIGYSGLTTTLAFVDAGGEG